MQIVEVRSCFLLKILCAKADIAGWFSSVAQSNAAPRAEKNWPWVGQDMLQYIAQLHTIAVYIYNIYIYIYIQILWYYVIIN